MCIATLQQFHMIGNTTASTWLNIHGHRIWKCCPTVSWEREVES